MSWKMIGKPATHKVTHALADRYATMEPAPGDRLLKGSRVEFLSNTIINGGFRTCEWASATCKETGKTYRVNGKHTSTALAAMNGEMPKDLHVITEHYECDTLEDVAKLYATFDTRKSLRSTGDINRSFAASIDTLDGISSRTINLCVTGIALATWGMNYTSVDPEQRANMLHQHPEFVAWFYETIGQKSAKNYHLYRGAVVAAMFMTWSKAKKHATEFWTLVMDGSGPKNTTADRVLHRLLLTSSVRGSRSGTGVTTQLDTRGMYAKCLHAWNAWRKSIQTGKAVATDLKYYPNAKLPIAS